MVGVFGILGEAVESGDGAAAPVQGHALTFSDFQSGLRQYNSGQGRDSAWHSGILVVVAVVAVFVVVASLRQKKKAGGPPDSEGKLARELYGVAGVGVMDRVLLGWVSRTTAVPVAGLLLSSRAFEEAVGAWAKQGTFGPARRWGKGRLERVRSGVFGGA